MPKRPRDSSLSSQSSFSSISTSGASHFSKIVPLANPHRPAAVMQCSLPPHPDTISFPSYADFEIHHAQTHANRCSDCRRNFPSEHFLALHIGENHDPLNEARMARGEKIYQCFLPECDKICSTPQKRRLHLIDKHVFPRTYDFQVINTGLDNRTSLLRTRNNPPLAHQHHQHHRRRSSAASRAHHQDHSLGPAANPDAHPPPSTSTPASPPPHYPPAAAIQSPNKRPNPNPPNIDALTTSLSSLTFIPPSIRFGRGGGRGRGRGGFAKS